MSPDVDVRARVWELHLRGVSKTRIGELVGLHRHTVRRIVGECYREAGAERRAALARKLSGAVARMRRVEEQAWEDHDADDTRERAALALMLGRADLACGRPSNTEGDGGDGRDGKESAHGLSGPCHSRVARYQSQRSQYLRVILEAEKEIARLEGLYEVGVGDDGGPVVFRIIREG